MMPTSLLSESLAQQAVLALLTEVSASPKPGLVDRLDCGAHKDMDFFTFMSSAASLSGYFERCAKAEVPFMDRISVYYLRTCAPWDRKRNGLCLPQPMG